MKRKTLGPIICLMCLACFAPAANAALTIVKTVGGGPPSGLNYLTFDAFTLGGTTQVENNVTVSFQPAAQVVNGSQSGAYAAPYLSGANGDEFGLPNYVGDDPSNYLTTGTVGSSVTLDFSGNQQYLGLLWGSVDLYNTLQFFSGNTLVGTIAGGAINATATGDQGLNGTFYVNINSDLPFDSVVATSTNFAFEFDNVAYSANQVPEPASLIVWSVLGLSVAGAGWWRRRKAAA